MMVKCPKYTAEFKKRAVDLYHARGGTYAEIARELGCGRRQRGRLSEEGARRQPAAGGQPFPGRGGAQASAPRERAVSQGERDPFKSERLLREQGAVKKAKFEFIAEFSARYRVSLLCSALGVTRQGHCAWRGRGRTSRKRVARIMRENGWRGVTRGNARRPSGERRVARAAGAPDLVRRDFSAAGPDEAWFADITYVRTHQGRPCLAVVMDVWSKRIVGWSMGPRIDAALADDALKMAIERRRPPAGCVHHSDHGAQYMSLLLGATMRRHGIRPSMGSVASPWDNAVTESLKGIVKSECVHARTFATRDEAAIEIFEYIERFYNRARIHSALGWMSPDGFERAHMEESRPRAA